MTYQPLTPEIVAALSRFFTGGTGPRHRDLTHIFTQTGFGDVAPFDELTRTPNKETRVRRTLQAGSRRGAQARPLVEGLLAEMRVHGCFSGESQAADRNLIRSAQQAFARAGWDLTNDGQLRQTGAIDLETGGRDALDEQLARLQRSIGDPGLAIGTTKDLLESVAKFVLEELGAPVDRRNMDFNGLWYLARDRLGIHPQQLAEGTPASAPLRKILQSAWTIAEQVNELRKLQGTGHGRTLPTGVSQETAWLVVREACVVVEFSLASLDRVLGH